MNSVAGTDEVTQHRESENHPRVQTPMPKPEEHHAHWRGNHSVNQPVDKDKAPRPTCQNVRRKQNGEVLDPSNFQLLPEAGPVVCDVIGAVAESMVRA
jgi:hypothetical protein